MRPAQLRFTLHSLARRKPFTFLMERAQERERRERESGKRERQKREEEEEEEEFMQKRTRTGRDS